MNEFIPKTGVCAIPSCRPKNPCLQSATTNASIRLFRWKLKGFQRAFGAFLCGCLVQRGERTVSKGFVAPTTTAELLPSSIVRSIDTNASGSNIVDPWVGDACFPGSLAWSAELPMSALFPISLLPPPKLQRPEGCIQKTAGIPGGSQRIWDRLRSYCCKIPKGRFAEIDTRAANNVMESDVPNQSDLDGSIIFSPTTTLEAHELIHSDHRIWDQNPRLVKVDALILHAPLFESLFRRTATLLGPRSESDKGKKCFVIDLDETLVHSSFKTLEQADFKVGVEIDGIIHRVYVLKRPHVDTFLATMANLYECVLFTASLAKYADPVADFIDQWNAFRYRLFRESCVYHRGNYVKDLSHLGRPLNQVVILDNSPASYMLHASHAVQISSWFDDANDRVLLDLIPYFERLATHPSVVEFLKNNAPPTPFAAVGTVGLPAAYLSPGSSIADLDDSKVISGTRRPMVASPLPISIASGSTVANRITRANHCSISSKPVPVIPNMTMSSIRQSISLPQPNTDPSLTFPSPFSLASLAHVSPHHSSITAVNRTIIDASKTRIRNHTNNSHNPSACDMNDIIVTTATPTLQRPKASSH